MCIRDSFYTENSPLWEIENDWSGFNWIESQDAGNNVIVYLRKDKSGKEQICVCNFAQEERKAYRFGVPNKGPYKATFQSNLEKYGGKGIPLKGIRVDKQEKNGKEYSACLTIPPLTFLVLSC